MLYFLNLLLNDFLTHHIHAAIIQRSEIVVNFDLWNMLFWEFSGLIILYLLLQQILRHRNWIIFQQLFKRPDSVLLHGNLSFSFLQ